MNAAGVVAALALFAALCSVLAAAATVSDWYGAQGDRLTTDLELLAIALLASVLLISLARYLSARAGSKHVDEPSGSSSVAVGALTAGMGVLVIVLGTCRVSTISRRLVWDDLMFLPAGLIFVFGGMLMSLQRTRPMIARLLGALLATSFALTVDWIAFAPGERHFGGGLSLGFLALGIAPSEWIGRTVFGLLAVLATVIAAMVWTAVVRSKGS